VVASKSASSTRLGALAVSRGILGGGELARCLRRQDRLRRAGIRLRLGQVLVGEDLISTSQLVQLLEAQRHLRK
jgi:hypothetical protein